MEYRCTKVRDGSGAYTDGDGKATPARCYEVHFEPVDSQHEAKNGVTFLKVWFWNTCPVEQGKTYELPDFTAKLVEYVLVKK